MSECKHKVTGAADWQGECPYCKLEQLEMDQVFYRLAVKERDYERERNARLEAENNLLQAAQGMLKAERDALKAEAARYLWLKRKDWMQDIQFTLGVTTNEAMDAEIDACIAKEE